MLTPSLILSLITALLAIGGILASDARAKERTKLHAEEARAELDQLRDKMNAHLVDLGRLREAHEASVREQSRLAREKADMTTVLALTNVINDMKQEMIRQFDRLENRLDERLGGG